MKKLVVLFVSCSLWFGSFGQNNAPTVNVQHVSSASVAASPSSKAAVSTNKASVKKVANKKRAPSHVTAVKKKETSAATAEKK